MTTALSQSSSSLTLPTRMMVLVFTDIEGSVRFKSTYGTPAYAAMLSRHDTVFRSALEASTDGRVLKDTGDGFFAAFERVSDAVNFALRFQHAMTRASWNPQPLRTRVGIHIGEVTEIEKESTGLPKVVGMAADVAARVMGLGVGGQILLTRSAFDEGRQFVRNHPYDDGTGTPALEWKAHGRYLFQGSDEPVEVFEVGAVGEAPLSPPADGAKARRAVAADEEETLGWRPATGLAVPNRRGWVLEHKLGEGGFGEVWLGKHERTKQRRVFKFCFDVERLRSFKRELTLFRLMRDALGDRSDIAKLYEVQLDRAPFFLESEYTEGGSLADWVERQGGTKHIPLARRLEIVASVADAVAAAHSVGILHKDIKPSNILIHVSKDGSIQPRLSDFGIGILYTTVELERRGITQTGFTQFTQNDSSRTGTRMYAPPELLSERPFTIQGDVYALGVLLYQMAIGDLSQPLAEGWQRDVDDEVLREDIAACVDGDPARRLSSAAEIATRIRTLEKRRPTPAQRAARWVRRNKLFAAFVLAVLFGSFGYVGWLYARPVMIELKSLPDQAEVYVNGVKEVCCTPTSVKLPFGRHELRFKPLDGYVEQKRIVQVSWGRVTGTGPIVFAPNFQDILFDSEPRGAAVEIRGLQTRELVASETTRGYIRRLPLGVYEMTISLDGYEPVIEVLDIRGSSDSLCVERKLEPLAEALQKSDVPIQ